MHVSPPYWATVAPRLNVQCALLSSALSLPVAELLRAGLNRLGTSSRSARVIHRYLEPFASCDSPGTFGGHHDPHLTTNLGGHVSINQRLLNRGRELALPAVLGRTSAAVDSLDVCRLNPVDGFDLPLRRVRISADLKARSFLDDRFSVPRGRCVANRLEPLRVGGDPPLSNKLG